MPGYIDGPSTTRFHPLLLSGGCAMGELASAQDVPLSAEMRAALAQAPDGECVSWGLPFHVQRALVMHDQPVSSPLQPTRAGWLVFQHTSDLRPTEYNAHGFLSPTHGQGRLNEAAAAYVVLYEDGSEERLTVRRRQELGAFARIWGENCFQAVPHLKPLPRRAGDEQTQPDWGRSQTRVSARDGGAWVNWLWAWQNPHPQKRIVGLRCEPLSGLVILSALSAGEASSQPLRWESRRKVLLTLAGGEAFRPEVDDNGLLTQIQLDMGQVISATPRLLYPQDAWEASYNNQLPEVSAREVIVEYTAHPQAAFHLADGRVIPLENLETTGSEAALCPISPATQRVTLRVVERGSSKPVPVKLHVHGEASEYLAPLDRHRQPNVYWFEDYSVDFVHQARHACTYIPGETEIKLPLGRVYLEVSRGFELRPLRSVVEVRPETCEIVLTLDRVLPWRARGWVSADTHVHFLSPVSALLEGSAEGVNVVNLLASQWGELMTNVGDFDGATTWGSREAGGEGEHLVRVGTENRQHILGHISLLGYAGPMIVPMTTGGPDESAIGDAIECLLTEWARQCHRQGGLVVIPHFPNPRAEHAATIVEGEADAVEMTSWGNLYAGINPYSLSDWYRYLNCGYRVPAVAGTDKMSATTAVGTVRTYARLLPDEAFSYAAWMQAVRRGETFVSYGPLLEFSVEGQPMGGRLALGPRGGRVEVAWEVASVTVPTSRVELVVNGEIRESVAVSPAGGGGHWSLPIERSAWLALLVRGHYDDKPEIIAAHSSPVFAGVEGAPYTAAADALTILEQIEGALAYLDTVGTRAETQAYRRMRLVLEAAHRRVHNQLHQMGHYHAHTPPEDHAAHHTG